jgi:hypothetical protein
MADLKVVKVDPVTHRRVTYSLKDISPYWLYDTKTVDNNNKVVSFFNNVNRSNEIETNMQQDGVLPSGWKFNVIAVRVVPDFSAAAADIAQLIMNSIVTFDKEGSEIFSAPAFVFNAGAGVNEQPTNGMPSTEAVLPLPLQMRIEGNTPFRFTLKVDDSVNLQNAIKVKMVLDGIIYKNIVTA